MKRHKRKHQRSKQQIVPPHHHLPSSHKSSIGLKKDEDDVIRLLINVDTAFYEELRKSNDFLEKPTIGLIKIKGLCFNIELKIRIMDIKTLFYSSLKKAWDWVVKRVFV